MLIQAAICPHPPLLVPEVAGAAAAELDGLRAACDAVVRALTECRPDLLVVVGGGPRTREYDPGVTGGLQPYGVDLTVGGPAGGTPVLPLSLTIGCWLAERAGAVPDRYQEVGWDEPAAECSALGRRLADAAGRVALLVMGDGSACRSAAAPGHLDDRAEPYDAEVARALAHGDAAVLTELDPALSTTLMAAGRGPWQVLAGAAGDDRFEAELLADDAPYGVGYLVAAWRRPQAVTPVRA